MLGLKTFTEQGVTRIRTRRQNLRLLLKGLTVLLGAVAALYIGSAIAGVVAGHGWHLPQIHHRPLTVGKGSLLNLGSAKGNTRHLQFPFTLWLPAGWAATACAAVPVWIGWIVLQRRVLSSIRRYSGPDRHRGLASLRKIRQHYSRRAVRRKGKVVLPHTTRWQRMFLPTNSFGYVVGSPREPRSRMKLWFNFETRLRIVARQGWGKSWRLLIPIIRQLPGAALITSVEAEIFTTTVKARMWRLPPVRYRWMRRLRKKWRTPVRYPVVVVDLSAPESKFASGFPKVQWNPIDGSDNFTRAANRARALVAGGDSDGASDSSTDKFFRDSATQVLAAWLQAAAMDPSKDIEDIVGWLSSTDLATPQSILQSAATAEARTAIMNMLTHLDPAAGRTTSGVKRYLNFAITSLSSGQGRELCGPRGRPQFDMAELIRADGTVYLLAEPDQMELARPILTLFACEMFWTAERVARQMRKKRLPRTFMGVFDELLAGVRCPTMPYICAVLRKFGISLAYAIQSSSDEEEMFSSSAVKRIRTLTTTIYGGYDEDSAQGISRRAGHHGVVGRSRAINGFGGSEQVQLEEVLPESDQQQLEDGQSIVMGMGISPFLAFTHRADRKRKTGKAIHQQMDEVETFVNRHRDNDLARQQDLQARIRRTTLTKENA